MRSFLTGDGTSIESSVLTGEGVTGSSLFSLLTEKGDMESSVMTGEGVRKAVY